MALIELKFYSQKLGMQTDITEELPSVIGEFLKVSTKRDDTYIAGLSMGGYGALKAALTDKYKRKLYFSCAKLFYNIFRERFNNANRKN